MQQTSASQLCSVENFRNTTFCCSGIVDTTGTNVRCSMTIIYTQLLKFLHINILHSSFLLVYKTIDRNTDIEQEGFVSPLLMHKD